MEKADISVIVGEHLLNYRVSAIIKKENKVLVHHSIGSEHFTLPGGRVKEGESSIEALQREIKEEMDFETGLGAWRELIADPVDTENVKEHKGIDPENKDVSNRADKMVIIANMDVQQYSLFSWEKNVSLIEGEFPTYKNKGIIVEQRYAKKNNLKVGDEVKYTIGDQSEATSLQICGIYKVDSDFEIYDSNEEGTSVYIHSPYNSIYVDYDYIVELLGLEYTEKKRKSIILNDGKEKKHSI